MNICYGQASRQSDAELNRVYQRLDRKLFGLKSQFLLHESETAWIAYRDAECKFTAAGTGGGTVQPTVHGACLDQLTRDRIKALQSQLNCQDGDLSCAQNAPAVWDGEWKNGTELMVSIAGNKVNSFYWGGDYKAVNASKLSADARKLSFGWDTGSAELSLDGESAAHILIHEKGRPDRTVPLEH